MAQTAQRLGLNLPHPLPGDVEFLTDLLQRMGLAVLKAKAQPQDLLLPGRQAGHGLFQLLPQQIGRRRLQGLRRLIVLNEVPQVAVILLADRRLQGDRVLGDL